MHVLVTCKNEEDPIKNELARVATTFLPLQVYWNFSIRQRESNSAALGPILPKFELSPNLLVVLVTFKNEEDLIKMKALKWHQENMLIFGDQGQITPKSVVGSDRNSNSDPRSNEK